MINNYEIKIENNEQVLYLYFDFNTEFASFDFKKNNKNLENTIKKYIKDNKIVFKGVKVAIVASGILMGSLLLNEPIIEDTEYYRRSVMNNIVEKIKLDEAPIIEKEELNEEIKAEVKKEEIKIENTKEEIIKPTVKEEIKIENTKEEIKEQIKEENSNKTEVVEKEETNESEIKENKTYVTIYRNNGTVETIELEEYIIGVVSAEMPASFHNEALKAQAIIARTYALKSIKNNRVLTDTSSTQNYKDNKQLQSMWGNEYNRYYNKVKSAVESTKGMYITYKGELIEAVYHSTSNGYTEDSINVWGNDYSYLTSVESQYDSINKSFLKETFITYEKISKLLNMSVNKDTEFNILSYTSSQRVEQIEVNDNMYTGVELRTLLGLRSADFEIKKEENGINFVTKGYGHGVGMSQYGAYGMAKNGYTYAQILKHYYQGITISYM